MELRKEGNRPVRQAPGWRRLATAEVHATQNGKLGHACSSLRGMAAPHGVATGGVVVSERRTAAGSRWNGRREQRPEQSGGPGGMARQEWGKVAAGGQEYLEV